MDSSANWLVTGSRNWDDWDRFREILDWVYLEHGAPKALLHGGSWGADAMASRWAYSRRVDLRIFGAQWRSLDKAAGPVRNTQMLYELVTGDIVIGFPLGQSRGTRHMLDIARKAQGLIIYEVEA